ncbi:YceI family protein [Arenimonas sp. MALMAid1274]|uniref:YceI family protein n=1 Tax=Arenimonas sp. MALMAid1274 TaxID=3411630 RepID=UPI003BA04931
MPMRSTCLIALACLASLAAHAAEPAAWRLDPVHTRVAFHIDHAGFSRAIGTFSGTHGQLWFDPDDWSSARLDVRIPLASLDLGEAGWNAKVLGRGFLDATGQPEARFTSTRVQPTSEGQAEVHGQLHLRGQSRPVTLQVTLNAIKRHPITKRRTVGFSATGRLSRRDFGIDAWPNVIGDEVRLMIEVEALRTSATEPPPTQETPDADQE